MKLKTIYSISIMTLALLTGANALAVPMVRQTMADFKSSMATVYPDSDNPNLFYFLPNTGGVAKGDNGQPMISLTYKDIDGPDADTKGKGFMAGVLEAGITPALKEELQSFQTKHPGARLTVVPFGKSYITFGKPVALLPPTSSEVQKYVPTPATQDQDMTSVVSSQKPPSDLRQVNTNSVAANGFSDYFKSLYLPPDAGVAETQEGFNGFLTADGAIMFRAGVTGNDLLNMNLCYEIYGALPTMSAAITMNYQRIYSYFQASASGGWGWWGWSLNAVVEKLIESKDIQIVITGADDKMEDYVLAVAKDLASTFLIPTLTATPGPSNTSPGFAFNQFGFNSTYKEERKTATWKLTEQKYVTDLRCNALPLHDLAPYADKILIDAGKFGGRH